MFENLVDIPKLAQDKIIGIIKKLAQENNVEARDVKVLMQINEKGNIDVFPHIKGNYQKTRTIKELLT